MDWTYFLMLSFLITHELDAVQRHEWRVLPITSFLPDRIGQHVFIWAHVPLFAGLFSLGGLEPSSTTALWISAFSIIHVFLHVIFRNHPNYEFNNLSSWTLIVGAAVFGTMHMLLRSL